MLGINFYYCFSFYLKYSCCSDVSTDAQYFFDEYIGFDLMSCFIHSSMCNCIINFYNLLNLCRTVPHQQSTVMMVEVLDITLDWLQSHRASVIIIGMLCNVSSVTKPLIMQVLVVLWRRLYSVFTTEWNLSDMSSMWVWLWIVRLCSGTNHFHSAKENWKEATEGSQGFIKRYLAQYPQVSRN